MLIKYLIIISFLNLVLSEAFALVCLEDNDTIKYEYIFNNCCKEDTQIILAPQNTFEPEIQKSTDVCCVDYDHNYTYVHEQYVMNFNRKDFSLTEIAATGIATQYSNYDCQKITSINFYNLHQVRTTIIRI